MHAPTNSPLAATAHSGARHGSGRYRVRTMPLPASTELERSNATKVTDPKPSGLRAMKGDSPLTVPPISNWRS